MYFSVDTAAVQHRMTPDYLLGILDRCEAAPYNDCDAVHKVSWGACHATGGMCVALTSRSL